MRIIPLLAVALAVVSGASAAVWSVSQTRSAMADTLVSNPAPAVVSPEPAPASPAPEPVVVSDTKDSARHEHLRAYTLDVMNGWSHAVPSMPVADYGDVASDLSMAVIMEPDDGQHCGLMPAADGFRRCLWGVPGWNSDHAKTVLLAALGYWEGARYAAYVDDGRCDDKAWRNDPVNSRMVHLGGNCDNGHAMSLWQIHPIVDQASSLHALCSPEIVSGSRLGAARCALALARMSMASYGNLVGYTGEPIWDHTKADKRLDFAQTALTKHPFTPLPE